jgi:signal transduction histidine kinase/CheY-like chemotaxis protein
MQEKILLVDDEEAIRTILGMSLEDLGYAVATAANGEEALDLIPTFAPDVVLSDIKMPGIDGIELLQRIKAARPEIEVIMVSGHGDMDLAIASLQLDAADFLTKPVRDPLLQKSLARTFEKINLRRQIQDYTRNLEQMVAEKSARVVELERRLTVGQMVDGLIGVMKGLVEAFDQGQGFFSDLPCYISVHSRALEVVAVNQLFRERMGSQVGRPSCSVFTDQGLDSCPIASTLHSGKGQRCKTAMRDPAGCEIPVVVHTAPIVSQAGAVELVVAIAVDLSEVGRLQKDLRVARERYQRLFDAVPCYISVVDRDFRIVECNQRFREDFGECRQLACHSVFAHRSDVCPDCPIFHTFQDGRSHQSETVVTVKGGLQRNLLVWSAPLLNEAGQVEHVMEIGTDITRLRKLQDNLSLLGLMIGSMSHGVKGILTSLDGGIYKVETGLAKGNQKRVEEGWAMVRDKAARIKKTVLDILYYAKSREVGLAELDVGDFAAQVAAIVRPKAEARGIAYRVDIPEDLGRMEMDEMAMSAALVNFLENSVDACADDLEKEGHAITFRAQCEGDEIAFVITDNGMGMEQETKEKMFTLFFSSKGAKGTGLGLYISNQVVQQHGGRIGVESDYGVGTTVTVRLPRKRPAGVVGDGSEPPAASLFHVNLDAESHPRQ